MRVVGHLRVVIAMISSHVWTMSATPVLVGAGCTGALSSEHTLVAQGPSLLWARPRDFHMKCLLYGAAVLSLHTRCACRRVSMRTLAALHRRYYIIKDSLQTLRRDYDVCVAQLMKKHVFKQFPNQCSTDAVLAAFPEAERNLVVSSAPLPASQ